MYEWILAEEPTLRLGLFISLFLSLAICEYLIPKRRLSNNKKNRWLQNLLLSFISIATVRIFFYVTLISIATLAQEKHWGLIRYLSMPEWSAILIGIILLDCVIYWQHRVFHKIPLLWRLHQVHHSDGDLDVTSGIRFHPIEIVLSMLIKITIILLLGIPPVAVLLFEIILSSSALFNHSNINLPRILDSLLRCFIVTPDMHRIHHSTITKETNSNYGFNLPWWDHLFSSYRPQPELGHQNMQIGLDSYPNSNQLTLKDLIIMPFKYQKKSQRKHRK